MQCCLNFRYNLSTYTIVNLRIAKVSDTGEGISKDKQAGLFTPFYQADSSSTRVHGGTGKQMNMRYLFIFTNC
jgi:signal transduction histidine kinase